MSKQRIEIHDANDPRVACFANLRHPKPTLESTLPVFVAEGSLVVQRLIKSDYSIQSVLIQAGKSAGYLDTLPSAVPVYEMQVNLIRELAGYDFHRGILATGIRRPFCSVQDYVSTLDTRDSNRSNVSLGVVGISDGENLGSILRSAAALGVDRVLFGHKTLDPFNRRVIRVSMANVLGMSLYEMADLENDLLAIQNADVAVIASTLDPAAPKIGPSFSGEKLILVGNEASGLPPIAQEIVRNHVRIPMQDGVDSLNVAAATAILIYHFSQVGESTQ